MLLDVEVVALLLFGCGLWGFWCGAAWEVCAWSLWSGAAARL